MCQKYLFIFHLILLMKSLAVAAYKSEIKIQQLVQLTKNLTHLGVLLFVTLVLFNFTSTCTTCNEKSEFLNNECSGLNNCMPFQKLALEEGKMRGSLDPVFGHSKDFTMVMSAASLVAQQFEVTVKEHNLFVWSAVRIIWLG